MEKFDKFALGKRLRAMRNERGLGQNALSAAIDASNASISLWETGKQIPSAEAIYKIASFFGVSADYVLGLTDKS